MAKACFIFLCLSVGVHFYMKYLLVQHCHLRKLSCSTRHKRLSFRQTWEKGAHTGGYVARLRQLETRDFVEPFRTVRLHCCPVPPNKTNKEITSCVDYRIRLALPILPHQGSLKTCCSELSSFVAREPLGLPQTSVGLSCIVVLSSIYSTAF